MKRFLFSNRQPRAIAVHCVPIVEELESRRLLAVTGAASLLPAVHNSTLGQGQQAAPLANNLTATQPSTIGPATNPTVKSALPTFVPPASFFNLLAGPAAVSPFGLAPSATTGALPSSAASINALTPQQALAQRAVIATVPSAPAPAYAYGEGMIIYVEPLELSQPPSNNPVTTNDRGTAASLETRQPGQESATAQQTSAEWQDAVDAYFADKGVR